MQEHMTMDMRNCPGVIAGLFALLLSVTLCLGEQPVAFGGKNFYPSQDRPIGFRGDGSGYYPGATPVSQFTEGTAEKVKIKTFNSRRNQWREEHFMDLADQKSKNIVWKTKLSSWGHSQPIIVGDKVYTTGDPHTLYCLDMRTGEVLWEKTNSVFEALCPEPEKARELESYVQQVYVALGVINARVGAYRRLPSPWKAEYVPVLRREFEMVRAILQRLIDNHPLGDKAKPALERFNKVAETVLSLEPGARKERLGSELSAAIRSTCGWIKEQYSVAPLLYWDGYFGWAFPTPCSDGKAIYASFGQSQVAAYDLAGRRLWIRHIPYPKRIVTRANHAPSPRLAGDVLIAQAPGQLVGLDKHTGKVLWKRPDLTPGGGYNVGTHYALKLESGRWILVTTHNAVLDVKTGKTILDLDGWHNRGGETGGASIIGRGNEVFFDAMKEDKSQAYVGFEFSEGDGGKITRKQVLKVERQSRSNSTPIVAGDYVYRFVKPGKDLYRISDGTVSNTWPNRGYYNRYRISYMSPVLIGKTFFLYTGRGGTRGRLDRRNVLEVVTAPLEAPGKIGEANTGNLIDVSDWPPDYRRRKYAPEIYKELDRTKALKPDEVVLSRGLLSDDGGLPEGFGLGGFCATGNRVVLRTLSSVVCIGDPAKPYDWNPASAKSDGQ